MKRFIIASVALLIGMTIKADDLHLYIYSGTDTPASYAWNDLKKISFENGNVVVTTKNGATASVPLNSITDMHFNEAEAESVELTPADNQTEKLYDMAGRRVNATSATAAPGLYIVKEGSRTQKMLKR